jgi:hypothetical protein
VRDVRKLIRWLYRSRDGFKVPLSAKSVVDRARSCSMYGEILPTAALQLIDFLELSPNDNFYDLGSGTGKLVLSAAMASEAKCVGIELVEPRWQFALDALADARELGAIRAHTVEFRKEDFMTSDLSDATVVYTCSTGFPLSLMKKLAHRLALSNKGLTFVTLQDLDPTPWFEPRGVLTLDMSWRRRVPVYLYELTNPRRFEPPPERRRRRGRFDAYE